MKSNYFFLLILPFFIFQCSATTEGQAGDWAITNAHIISVTQDTTLENHTIIIDSAGMIKKIGPSSSIRLDDAVTVVNANGQFLTPGLSEMHAHIPVAQEGNDTLVKETLFLYLSQGITLIRGMLGNPYHLTLKEQVANGEILSPRIYTSSPSMNGNTVQSPEEANTKVAQYKFDGYDFLKIHPGIQLDAFKALVKTSRSVGIPFAGHVPEMVGIENALNFEYATIDHLDGYMQGLVPASSDMTYEAMGLFGMFAAAEMDETLIEKWVQMTLDHQVGVVPTHSLMTRWSSPRSGAEMLQDPGVKYMPAGTRFQWRTAKDRMLQNEHYDEGSAQIYLTLRNKLLKAMYDNGVQILLGSDAPQIFNVPGFSIHHEMKAMADAGLPNRAILASGSIEPARYFGNEDRYGEIKEGRVAEFILLGANPLDDIANMRQVKGVMVGGNWLSEAFISERLAAIAKRHE